MTTPTPQAQMDEILRLANEMFGETDGGQFVLNAEELSAFASKVRESEREACADLIPTNWLDPILSGKGAIKLPAGCPEIETLLREIGRRIRSRTSP